MAVAYAWERWEQTCRMFGANFSKALFFHFSFSPFYIAVFVQWLKQIEGTEAALTQKMLDLENEKVRKGHQKHNSFGLAFSISILKSLWESFREAKCPEILGFFIKRNWKMTISF